MAFRHILFDVQDEIATITLNRPEARNALSPEMGEDLDAAVKEIRERAGDDIKSVIITGAGGAFCAGGDVKAMKTRSQSPAAARHRMRGYHTRLYELMNLELPVIVAVDGAAAGAGFNFALVGDFILASERAVFMQAFGRIGLVPDWGGFFLLPRIVGLQKAKELVFTARRLSADEAKALGIVYAVHPQERLMDEARALAGRFRNASTEAIGIAKNILNQSFNLDHRTLLELEAFAQPLARETDYHKQAVGRFVAKEPSIFAWEEMDKAARPKQAAE